MKRRTASTILLAALGTFSAAAQQVVAPTTESVGSPRGQNIGDYNITQSFETGYRFDQVSGDSGEYRSVANFGNGIRLLGSSLNVNSRDGHGKWFDSISLTTSGLGNDPYESVVLRVEKNKLYRYDMSWRLSDYFNPGLTVAGGLHKMDTSRRIQDHELTLLPQSSVRLHLGYSRNTEDGPALSSALEFNSNGEGYPVFMDVKRNWNEYRISAEGELDGFRFLVMHRWDFFKDDSGYSSDGVVSAINPFDSTVLQHFTKSAPLHGRSPAWLGNVFTRRKKWGMNARFSYVKGVGDFALDEASTGLDQFGTPATRQITVGGEATRPEVVGDLNISIFPTSKLTFTDNVSIFDQRMTGNSVYSEVLTGLDFGSTLNVHYLGIRTIANAALVDYQVNKWLGIYGGYDYSDRSLTTIEGAGIPSIPGTYGAEMYEVSNIEQAGRAGIRLRPLKALTINMEGELDRDSHPLTPVDPGHYHTLNARVAYRVRNLQLSGAYREVYNANPESGFLMSSSHTRNYSANASWSARSWLSLDASYSKLHLDSSTFLAFFAGVLGPQYQTGASLYVSNIHSGNLGASISIGRRANLYAGYSIAKDTGDGRATAVPAGVTDPVSVLLASVQTFPLTYQSPLARLSIKISPKVRWNAGWQFYNYSELFHVLGYNQNFHANTGYTSVLWAF